MVNMVNHSQHVNYSQRWLTSLNHSQHGQVMANHGENGQIWSTMVMVNIVTHGQP